MEMTVNDKIKELYDKYVKKVKGRGDTPLEFKQFKEQVLSEAMCQLGEELIKDI